MTALQGRRRGTSSGTTCPGRGDCASNTRAFGRTAHLLDHLFSRWPPSMGRIRGVRGISPRRACSQRMVAERQAWCVGHLTTHHHLRVFGHSTPSPPPGAGAVASRGDRGAILRRMALTQQLARVTPQYLDRCRETAGSAPDGDPRWNPPADDVLDLDWAVWELLGLYRRMRPESPDIAVLERSIHGDGSAPVAFLDHIEVYDRIDRPPSLLSPAAVTGVARALAAMEIDSLLTTLPAYRREGGFPGFTGDPAAYLRDHFALLRSFYAAAAAKGMAMVVWVD
ncbi:hypothetical protein DNK55_32000 [Streptomyces sp. AC1-42T]|nr:hypothetical protein DNK55_32000 [Streptomyces sp. AC1-42T]